VPSLLLESAGDVDLAAVVEEWMQAISELARARPAAREAAERRLRRATHDLFRAFAASAAHSAEAVRHMVEATDRRSDNRSERMDGMQIHMDMTDDRLDAIEERERTPRLKEREHRA
jgi:hypothetical protein